MSAGVYERKTVKFLLLLVTEIRWMHFVSTHVSILVGDTRDSQVFADIILAQLTVGTVLTNY